METRLRWLVPMVIATALGVVATIAPAHAQDNPDRMLVDTPDLVFRDCAPRGDDRDDDRPAIRRDAYGRPIYFRYIPLDRHQVRNGPPYGNAQDGRHDRPGTWRSGDGGNAECRRQDGNCTDRVRVNFDDDDRGRRGDDD